jgi:hypothetical protein
MARGFVRLLAVVDWFSRRVLSHRVSITREADFRVEARGALSSDDRRMPDEACFRPATAKAAA